jgi:hypothetical protein
VIDFHIADGCLLFPTIILGPNMGTIAAGQSKPFSFTTSVLGRTALRLALTPPPAAVRRSATTATMARGRRPAARVRSCRRRKAITYAEGCPPTMLVCHGQLRLLDVDVR